MESSDESGIAELIAELDGPLDDEHPDISVLDGDSGWLLSAFQSGKMVWENVENDAGKPRHMVNVSRTEMARVMTLIATGNVDEVEALDWQAGYC
jgi:hypothetical protein